MTSGLLSLAVAAIPAWSFVGYWWHRGRLRVVFRDLAGVYAEREKYASQDTGRRLAIEVRGSRLIVMFVDGLPQGVEITGQIAMDERTRNTGRGQYEHVYPQRPTLEGPLEGQAWGFWEIQVKSKEEGSSDPLKLLVHTTFAEGGVARFRGYEWRKVR